MGDTSARVLPGRPQGPDWHRAAVGGHWDEIGQLQFDFLLARGLAPPHILLDIGCGSLRGGVHFIRYLQPGHYYGIDKEESLLEAGARIELARYGLERKAPHLHLVDGFDLTVLPDVQFDYMLAQSVFTHLLPDDIEVCLENVMPRLSDGGVLFATFFESPDGRVHPGETHPWRRNETRASHYPLDIFASMADRLGIAVEYLGDWSHPRGQKMLAFRPTDGDGREGQRDRGTKGQS